MRCVVGYRALVESTWGLWAPGAVAVRPWVLGAHAAGPEPVPLSLRGRPAGPLQVVVPMAGASSRVPWVPLVRAVCVR